MASQPRKLITVRVDADTAAAIERRVAQDAGLSDVVRTLIELGLDKSLTTAAKFESARQRADALRELSDHATLLRRLGNAHIYALKSRRPVDEAESQARIDALKAIEAAARRLI